MGHGLRYSAAPCHQHICKQGETCVAEQRAKCILRKYTRAIAALASVLNRCCSYLTLTDIKMGPSCKAAADRVDTGSAHKEFASKCIECQSGMLQAREIVDFVMSSR